MSAIEIETGTGTVGELLRTRRAELSLRRAADALGVTDRMYKMWEYGFSHPAADRAAAIGAWCGVSRYHVLALMGVISVDEARVLEAECGDGLDSANVPVASSAMRRYLNVAEFQTAERRCFQSVRPGVGRVGRAA